LHAKAITAKAADGLGVHFRCSRVNFFLTFLGQVRSMEPVVLAIIAGHVFRKHVSYEYAYEMIGTPIPLPI